MTQETKHSPAPWGYEILKDEIVIDSRTQSICQIRQVDENIEANAHLIAAAPELYDVLELVEKLDHRRGHDVMAVIDIAKAVLKKARGEL